MQTRERVDLLTCLVDVLATNGLPSFPLPDFPLAEEATPAPFATSSTSASQPTAKRRLSEDGPTELPVRGPQGRTDTDDFGNHARPLGGPASESMSRADSGDSTQGPNKRLRRGRPTNAADSPGASYVNSPAESSGVNTPFSLGNGVADSAPASQASLLRDQLSQFTVDSQPGSSASSAYGGGESQPVEGPSEQGVTPGNVTRTGGDVPSVTGSSEVPTSVAPTESSPVQQPGQRPVRGVRPVIQDSPSSVIDIRSSPNSAASPPPASISNPFATSSSQSVTSSLNLSGSMASAVPPSAGSPPFYSTSQSPPVAPVGTPAQSAEQQRLQQQHAIFENQFAQFSTSIGPNFSPLAKREAFVKARGDYTVAVQLLLNAQPSPQPPAPVSQAHSPSTLNGGSPNGALSNMYAPPSQPANVSRPMPSGQQAAFYSGGQMSPPPTTPQHQQMQMRQPQLAPASHLRLQITALPLQPGQGPEHQTYSIQGRPGIAFTHAQVLQFQAELSRRHMMSQQQQQQQQVLSQQSPHFQASQQQRTSPGHAPVRLTGGGRGGLSLPSPQQLQMISVNANQAFRRQLESTSQIDQFSRMHKDHQSAVYYAWLRHHPNPTYNYLVMQLPPLPEGTTHPPMTIPIPATASQIGQFRPGSQHRAPGPVYQQSQVYSPAKPMSLHERTLAAMQSTGRKKKKKRRPTSDSDGDGGDYSDDGDGDDFEVETPQQLARRENLAVEWFNTATKDELCELAGCNQTQAALTIKLRPFTSPTDFRTRTRKQKGVGNMMMDTYLEVIQGMHEIDKVLNDCEAIGRELSRVMSIWATGATAGGEAPTGTAGAPAAEQPDADVGINLVALSEDAVEQQSRVNPEVADAFKFYIRKQPEGVPDTITLKDYQMLGLNWLNLLYRRGTSCILADDMGLGKTAQVISLISHLKSTGEPGPHLIIVPSSTLENWMREFSVFAPSLHVESYYGSQYERAEIRMALREMTDLDVVVTTYNIATGGTDDQKFLKRKMGFKICVFDEGHQVRSSSAMNHHLADAEAARQLKNSQSKKYKDLMQYRTQWRLLLTGTPLQNNLGELISLLSFILPDQFRDASDSLRAIFKVGPGSQANLLSTTRISRAKKMMTPFVLRRKKIQVLKDLPQKSERIEWCEMTSLQREVYNEAITRSKRALLEMQEEELERIVEEDEDTEKASAGLSESKPKKKKAAVGAATKTGNISNKNSSSNVLMDLRKASNHPMLFRRLYTDKLLQQMSRDCLKEDEFLDRDKNLIYEDMEVMTDFELHRFCLPYKHLSKYALKNDEWMSAGKIHKLAEMLPKLKAQGDRVLLFSQFTQILDILEVVLQTLDMRYLKLTGQTSVTERQGLVDEFTNDPEITVFLLSTRAGGLGLNLTAANYVVFYDLDYNPHNDKQAEDRSFRIGQTRDVTIIKLITKDSLDEEIHHLAGAKLQLDASISATAGGDGDGDGVPAAGDKVEKRVRTSLLSNLKKKFEAETQQATQQAPTQQAQPQPDGSAAT